MDPHVSLLLRRLAMTAAITLTYRVPTNLQFATEIKLPDGDRAGDYYNPLMHPPQACLLQAVDQGYAMITVAKPVQDGGTLCSLVPMLRAAIKLHQKVVMAYPTEPSAKDIWTMKIWPILAAYGGQEPESGGGSRGGAARVVTLPGGGQFILRTSGGRGESQQASVTADKEMVDEVDDWDSLKRIVDIGQRIGRGRSPFVARVSTVKKDEGSFILSLVAEGTHTRLEYPCVHCGAYQMLSHDRINFDDATYRCMHCPAEWSDADRLVSLTKWKRVDLNPKALAFSILWTVLDSPLPILDAANRRVSVLAALSSLHHLATAAVERGDHSYMRSLYHDRFTSPYTLDMEAMEKGSELTYRMLLDRANASKWAPTKWESDKTTPDSQATYSRHIVDVEKWRPDIDIAVAGIDVQGKNLYWSLVGSNLLGTEFDLAWGYEYARADHAPWSQSELHGLLNRTLLIFQKAVAYIPLMAVMLDTGDFTAELMSWVAGHRPLVKPIKGHSENLRVTHRDDVEGIIYHIKGLYHVMIDNTRTMVQAGYRRPIDAPGAHLLPSNLQNDGAGSLYPKHLCAEMETIDPKTRKRRLRQGPGRWDLLDARRYAYAGIRLIRKEMSHKLPVGTSYRDPHEQRPSDKWDLGVDTKNFNNSDGWN